LAYTSIANVNLFWDEFATFYATSFLIEVLENHAFFNYPNLIDF
jgi:hypothetical protein